MKERFIRKIAGFTLIELIVTMSLMGILFAISAPVFSQFQSSSRLKSSVQMLETSFGEAFSSARSRPECFVIEGNEGSFSLKSYDREDCGELSNPKISRDFQLNLGVKFNEEFSVKFKPPFGDIEILEEGSDQQEIKMCNDECVLFTVHKKSGLVTREPVKEESNLNSESREI